MIRNTRIRRHCVGLAAAALVSFGSSARAQEFMVKLGLKHGHLREVYLGCKAAATDGFDRRIDVMAPPPGIETGYTAFVDGSGRFYLYKDLRAPAKKVEWTFSGRVFPGKPITVSWDPKELPKGVEFAVTLGDKTVDMRKQTEISFSETARLTFTATAVDKDAEMKTER